MCVAKYRIPMRIRIPPFPFSSKGVIIDSHPTLIRACTCTFSSSIHFIIPIRVVDFELAHASALSLPCSYSSLILHKVNGLRGVKKVAKGNMASKPNLTSRISCMGGGVVLLSSNSFLRSNFAFLDAGRGIRHSPPSSLPTVFSLFIFIFMHDLSTNTHNFLANTHATLLCRCSSNQSVTSLPPSFTMGSLSPGWEGAKSVKSNMCPCIPMRHNEGEL